MADVLIPGGFGFIGSHLTRACLLRGDHVTVLSFQRDQPRIEFDHSRVRHIRVDLREWEKVRGLLNEERPELVFNLSGYIDHTAFLAGGRSVFDQHFVGLQNLIGSIDRSALRLFVQVGSSDEYGGAPSPQREETRESPISPYSLGKMAASHLIQYLSKAESFPGIVVRLFLVYGPGQDSRRFITQLIQGCLSGKPFPVSEGQQKRDFTYVEDIVQGLLSMEKNPHAIGHVINLASGIPVMLRDLIEQVVKTCGQGNPEYGGVKYRPGENMSLVADITRRDALLSWKPKTSLNDGLQKTLNWYRAQNAVASRENARA